MTRRTIQVLPSNTLPVLQVRHVFQIERYVTEPYTADRRPTS